MQALANVTNPTPYAATIPYIHLHIFNHGHRIGEAVARDVDFQKGNNSNILVYATWDPTTFGGEKAREIGRRLLSDYISGKNTTLTMRTHRGSIPTMPELGEALSAINITAPAPRFELPGDDGDDPGHKRFIRDATFHIFSSSATFTLASPLHYNTVYVEQVNATAFYNHTEPIGRIFYDDTIAAPPGLSQTPRLPVTWSPSQVGYGKLKEALGGSLKLDAVANVTIRLGNWVEELTYEGRGIGARVRL